MKVALIRNVHESRSLSMPLYADCLRDALASYCNTMDVYLEPDLVYRMAGVMDLRIQDYIGRFWSFPRQLRRLNADMFHIIDHSNAHLIRSLNPTHTVVTCHDLMLLKLAAGEIPGPRRQTRIASTVFRWSARHLLNAEAVVCDSESTKRDVLKYIGCVPERVHVVYLGLHKAFREVLDSDVHVKARKHFGLTSYITILHTGKNTFYKNLEGAIKALSLLPNALRSRINFVKVGLDFTSEQWHLARRLGLSEQVRFLGQVNIQDLVLLYNVSEMLLFPSLYEGFGWPPLEAMACGTPVVCSNRGSLKEIVGDAAFIVDPEDPREIADGVERVLTDVQLRERMIAHGLERAKQFSWENTAEQVFRIYQEILGSQTNYKVADA